MRSGARLGARQVIDHMFLDGLEDAYDKGRLDGQFCRRLRRDFQFTACRCQEDYCAASLSRRSRRKISGGPSTEKGSQRLI